MYLAQISRVRSILNEYGVECKDGMKDEQFIQAENYYNFVFPPDYKELLRTLLPVSNSFYDWTDYTISNTEKIKKMISWPIEGALFDVENNDIWLKSWGNKPLDLKSRLSIARNNMEKVPKLIPIYSHRYVASLPNEENNPIYSVYQTEVIFYGENIWDYFEVEFSKKKHSEIDISKIKKVPFWHEMIVNFEDLV